MLGDWSGTHSQEGAGCWGPAAALRVTGRRGTKQGCGKMGLIQTLLSVDKFCQAADGDSIYPPQGLGVGVGVLPFLPQ